MTALVVRGRVLTVDAERRVIDDGAVYIHDGRIDAVAPASAAPPAGYTGAPRINTEGVVAPGLIDLHNHLAYNTLPLWVGRVAPPYETRYQWPGAASYQPDVSNPAQALGIAAPAAALRYAEVKAAVGGVTSIQGSPPVTRAFPGWMLRNVEKEQFGHGKTVFQSVLEATPAQLDDTAVRLKEGKAFIYHLAEGVAPTLRAEFTLLDDHHCARDGLVGIHSTALTSDDFRTWAANGGGAVVWSPFSNLWLYGATTDVLAARRHGLRVCLGSDWTPSGTRNVLGELKVAARYNRIALDGALDAADLVEMVTANPGDTLAGPWRAPVGRLVPGALADLACFAPVRDDPWETLLAATERHVRLVMVGGRPAYGNRTLVERAGVTDAETLTVAGIKRAVVMTLPEEQLPDDPDLVAEANQSWADGLRRLAAVWKDPGAAVREARQRRAFGPEPFEFVPDMPAGPPGTPSRALSDEELDQLAMPELDGLGHTAGFFTRLRRACPAHAAILRDLRDEF
jgi:cytosine/adenosine deaminase-related metal-dependent hydrolase